MRFRGAAVASAGALVLIGSLVGGTAWASPQHAAASTQVDAAAPTGQCADSALHVSVHYDAEAAGAGQRLSHIDFQNRGTRSCELRGAPGVSLVGHGNGTQVGRPADRQQTGTPPTVRLRPGESARADLQFEAVGQGGGVFDHACHAVKADGYRIYPPHSYRSVYVKSPQYACTATAIHWGAVGYLDAKPVGCATTAGGVPAGATRRSIADVDGDARRDTEWMTATRFGITTASGATTTVRPDVQGGADPRALTVVLRGALKPITLIAGSRDAQVFRFSGCRLQPVTNVQGRQYRFDLTNTDGDGVGCADPDGDGIDQLIGLRLSRPLGGLRDGDTVDIAATGIGITGLHAVNGRTRTTTATWPQDEKTITDAATITCRGASINHDGITVPAAE